MLLFRELWLEAAKKVFADLDSDSQGKVSSVALLNLVREKVPSSEVDYAVEDALVEAGYAGISLSSSKDWCHCICLCSHVQGGMLEGCDVWHS